MWPASAAGLRYHDHGKHSSCASGGPRLPAFARRVVAEDKWKSSLVRIPYALEGFNHSGWWPVGLGTLTRKFRDI